MAMERTDVSPLSSPAVAVLRQSTITTFRPYLLAEGFEAEALPKPKAKVQGTAEEAAAKAEAKAKSNKAWSQKNREKLNAYKAKRYRENPGIREKRKVYLNVYQKANDAKIKAYLGVASEECGEEEA